MVSPHFAFCRVYLTQKKNFDYYVNVKKMELVELHRMSFTISITLSLSVSFIYFVDYHDLI